MRWSVLTGDRPDSNCLSARPSGMVRGEVACEVVSWPLDRTPQLLLVTGLGLFLLGLFHVAVWGFAGGAWEGPVSWRKPILFGTSIDDKLNTPSHLDDSHPGAPIQVPNVPHRPKALALRRTNRSSTPFPRASDIAEKHARGHILHHFANHELLALELMALMLLKFPNAPKPIRKTLIHTMFDEQQHLRLYPGSGKCFGRRSL